MNNRKSDALSGRSNLKRKRTEEEASLRGPIAKKWICKAANMPGKSLHLALLIWCATSMNRMQSVTISNVDARSFGLERNAKYRALACLEDEGLISVERRLGKSPLVTLLDVGEDYSGE